MASENEASCESDPNFAVICGFLEKFGVTCGLTNIDFLDLQEMLENTQDVSQELIELHIKLLRKAKKSVSNERWERALIKMCHSYCSQDAWELERFGYKKSRISSKLRILKQLLEMQFDFNQKFKNEINKMSANELRTQPLGKDRLGHVYWCLCDETCQIRVYKEDPDEETWTLVAKDRDGLVSLISQLSSGDSVKSSSEPVSNEDSNSLEVEKPILDTGQNTDSSNSSSKLEKHLAEDNAQSTVETEQVSEIQDSVTLAPEELPENEKGDVEEPVDKNEADERKSIQNELSDEKEESDDEEKEKSDWENCGEANQVEKEDDLEGGSNESFIDDDDDDDDSNENINNNLGKEDNILLTENENALNLTSKNVKRGNLELQSKNVDVKDYRFELDAKVGLDLTCKPKPTLRLKPLTELLGQPFTQEADKKDFIGIKGKYIRGDSSSEKISLTSYSNSVLHRKAVQSASYDAISYKRSIEEEDYEEPTQLKRSRIERPTLLGNKKFLSVSYVDEEEVNEVVDEIEEPLMLVHGEGTGFENECSKNFDESPIVSPEIEEPIMYIFGESNGFDCQTGNENIKDADSQRTKVDKSEIKSNLSKTGDKCNNCQSSIEAPDCSKNIVDSKCNIMPPIKVQYKLGTIIDTKTNKITVKSLTKKSRWDVVPDADLKEKKLVTDTKGQEQCVESCNSSVSSEVVVNEQVSHCVEDEESATKITSGTVKQLVNKFESICESQTSSRMIKLCDNNNETNLPSQSVERVASELSVGVNEAASEKVTKSMFFFGSSSGTFTSTSSLIHSAALSFGASKVQRKQNKGALHISAVESDVTSEINTSRLDSSIECYKTDRQNNELCPPSNVIEISETINAQLKNVITDTSPQILPLKLDTVTSVITKDSNLSSDNLNESSIGVSNQVTNSKLSVTDILNVEVKINECDSSAVLENKMNRDCYDDKDTLKHGKAESGVSNICDVQQNTNENDAVPNERTQSPGLTCCCIVREKCSELAQPEPCLAEDKQQLFQVNQQPNKITETESSNDHNLSTGCTEESKSTSDLGLESATQFCNETYEQNKDVHIDTELSNTADAEHTSYSAKVLLQNIEAQRKTADTEIKNDKSYLESVRKPLEQGDNSKNKDVMSERETEAVTTDPKEEIQLGNALENSSNLCEDQKHGNREVLRRGEIVSGASKESESHINAETNSCTELSHACAEVRAVTEVEGESQTIKETNILDIHKESEEQKIESKEIEVGEETKESLDVESGKCDQKIDGGTGSEEIALTFTLKDSSNDLATGTEVEAAMPTKLEQEKLSVETPNIPDIDKVTDQQGISVDGVPLHNGNRKIELCGISDHFTADPCGNVRPEKQTHTLLAENSTAKVESDMDTATKSSTPAKAIEVLGIINLEKRVDTELIRFNKEPKDLHTESLQLNAGLAGNIKSKEEAQTPQVEDSFETVVLSEVGKNSVTSPCTEPQKEFDINETDLFSETDEQSTETKSFDGETCTVAHGDVELGENIDAEAEVQEISPDVPLKMTTVEPNSSDSCKETNQNTNLTEKNTKLKQEINAMETHKISDFQKLHDANSEKENTYTTLHNDNFLSKNVVPDREVQVIENVSSLDLCVELDCSKNVKLKTSACDMNKGLLNQFDDSVNADQTKSNIQTLDETQKCQKSYTNVNNERETDGLLKCDSEESQQNVDTKTSDLEQLSYLQNDVCNLKKTEEKDNEVTECMNLKIRIDDVGESTSSNTAGIITQQHENSDFLKEKSLSGESGKIDGENCSRIDSPLNTEKVKFNKQAEILDKDQFQIADVLTNDNLKDEMIERNEINLNNSADYVAADSNIILPESGQSENEIEESDFEVQPKSNLNSTPDKLKQLTNAFLFEKLGTVSESIEQEDKPNISPDPVVRHEPLRKEENHELKPADNQTKFVEDTKSMIELEIKKVDSDLVLNTDVDVPLNAVDVPCSEKCDVLEEIKCTETSAKFDKSISPLTVVEKECVNIIAAAQEQSQSDLSEVVVMSDGSKESVSNCNKTQPKNDCCKLETQTSKSVSHNIKDSQGSCELYEAANQSSANINDLTEELLFDKSTKQISVAVTKEKNIAAETDENFLKVAEGEIKPVSNVATIEIVASGKIESTNTSRIFNIENISAVTSDVKEVAVPKKALLDIADKIQSKLSESCSETVMSEDKIDLPENSEVGLATKSTLNADAKEVLERGNAEINRTSSSISEVTGIDSETVTSEIKEDLVNEIQSQKNTSTEQDIRPLLKTAGKETNEFVLPTNPAVFNSSNEECNLQQEKLSDVKSVPYTGKKRGRKPKLSKLNKKQDLIKKFKLKEGKKEMEHTNTSIKVKDKLFDVQDQSEEKEDGNNSTSKIDEQTVLSATRILSLRSKRTTVQNTTTVKPKTTLSFAGKKKAKNDKKLEIKAQKVKGKMRKQGAESTEKLLAETCDGDEAKIKTCDSDNTKSKSIYESACKDIKVRASLRQKNKELVKKSEESVKKTKLTKKAHLNKKLVLCKKTELIKKPEVRMKVRLNKRGVSLNKTADNLIKKGNHHENDKPGIGLHRDMNLTVELERCDVPTDNIDTRTISLRERRSRYLGNVKSSSKKGKVLLKKSSKIEEEPLRKKENLILENVKYEPVMQEAGQEEDDTGAKVSADIQIEDTPLGYERKGNALVKIDAIDLNKSAETSDTSECKQNKVSEKSVTSSKHEPEEALLNNRVTDLLVHVRRSSRLRTMGDAGTDTNVEHVKDQDVLNKETDVKDKNEAFCDKTLTKRLRLSDDKEHNTDDIKPNLGREILTTETFAKSVEIDPLEMSTSVSSKGKQEEVETIDLTLENESMPSTAKNAKQTQYQEKFTDCKQGVMIKGVLIKGDVTIKIKEKIPVEEPKCVKKNVPLLTCVSIEKLKEPENNVIDNFEATEPKSPVSSPLSIVSSGADVDNNSDVVIIEDDPLGDVPDEIVSAPFTLSSFKLDFTDPLSTTVTRALRKRVRTEPEPEQIIGHSGGKKRKVKGKRQADLELRKSIEEQKKLEVSSSEDDNIKKYKGFQKKKQTTNKTSKIKKRSSSALVNVDSSGSIAPDSPLPILVDSSDAPSLISKPEPQPNKRSPPKKRKKTLLGLEIPSDMELQNDIICSVRQSRRIAQIKIKEEAERRKLEDIVLNETKREKKQKGKKHEDKDYKAERRKKSKNLIIEDEIAVDVPEPEEKKKRKKRRKHKDPRKIFDESNPWRSSSGSSTSNEEEEEEEIVEYSEADSPLFRSDHEFSPESDLEESGEVQPLKRARTARKEDDVEEDLDEHACQKCGKADHPEWILLCDGCDNGWHCSCLRPALLVIPEGDWYCPPCQHNALIKNLESKLVEYDKKLTKRGIEERRKERLAYVGITLANVLPVKDASEQKQRKKQQDKEDEESESNLDSESESESTSESDSDEPIYQLRERRQAHSYRFNDYDELINSAIQDEVEAKGVGNKGRGKDISTIVNAEREEARQKEVQDLEELPPVVPLAGKELSQAILTPEQDDSDDNQSKPVRKLYGRKKHRKLNSLDVSSGDDPDSDEDFKGSSSAEEEDEYDDMGSESSEGYSRRKGNGPVRRSTRARVSRYDKEFINDDSEDDAPRRKKTKSIWDETESEESDHSWGRSRRKTGSKRRLALPKKRRTKKSKKYFSDSENDDVYKKKKPKIKYGGLDDDDEEEVGRRTRGKRINYLDALASDSDEEVKRRGPPRIESDDEYDANKEQDDDVDESEEDKDSDENTTSEIPKAPTNFVTTTSDAQILLPEKTLDAKAEEKFEQNATGKDVLPETLQIPSVPELFEDQENEDDESELNPIEEINKNLEQMDEREMEMMMEEEEYANKQLQLMALQLEKEKKRKEREAKKLEKVVVQEQKVPKKRGRKPKANLLPSEGSQRPTNVVQIATLQVGPDMQSNPELSEPPGVTIPIFSDLSPAHNTSEGTPKKRRGRGKGKKTLEKEQAAAAAAVAATYGYKDSMDSSNSDHIPSTVDSVASNNSNSSVASSPMQSGKLTIAAPPQPFSQSQPAPSVITRMLQTQTGQGNFPLGMGHKYYSTDPPSLPDPSAVSGSSLPVPPPTQGQYVHGVPRGVAPPYRQQLPSMNAYSVVRSNPAPAHRLRPPPPPQGIPPMYHTHHHPLDPSPSGGGPINVPGGPMNMSTTSINTSGNLSGTERNSPGVATPTSDSPLSNKSDQTPPPPPYTRPQMARFPPGSNSPLMSTSPMRHPHLLPPQHVQQSRTGMPYHPGMPPNYFNTYIPPNITTEETLPPSSYHYSEQFSGGNSPQDAGKAYEEENSGEFGGLVSYFSSQREDDLDT